MNTKVKAWINLVLFVLTVAINAMGAYGVFNGMTQKQVSDAYPTLITPSPSTFSIWGVIYLFLLIALVLMIIQQKEKRTADLIDAISLPFWIASLANIVWIVTFSFEQIGLSTLLIATLVIALAIINSRIKTPIEFGEKISAVAFGLYNGWLIIATVVNVAAFLVQVKWDRFGLAESTWALIILGVALIITILIQLRLRNAALTLPLAWAYFGIWQVHRASGTYLGQYKSIAITAMVLACLYVLISVIVFTTNRFCVLLKRKETN